MTTKKQKSKVTISESLKVTVDYTKTVEEIIAAGSYSNVYNGIGSCSIFDKKYDPPKESEEIEIILLYLGQWVKIGRVLARLNRQGFRPITLFELLTLGIQCPEMILRSTIFAFGSCWHSHFGELITPSISIYPINERQELRLSLSSFKPETGILGSTCIAAVRK